MKLTEASEKAIVIISAMRINPRDVGKLSQLGLRVGSEVLVERFAPLGGPVMVRVGSREIALGKKLANKIQVEPV